MNCNGSHLQVESLLLLMMLFLSSVGTEDQQQSPANHSFSVAVRCSVKAMEMFVHFKEPFHGRLQTRPNGRCFVNGRGRLTVGFRLPLDEEHQRKCSIVRREEEFVAIVDLEMNPTVVTGDDNAYFVRCPILGPAKAEATTSTNPSGVAVGNVSAQLDVQLLALTEGPGPTEQLLEFSLKSAEMQGQQNNAILHRCVAFSPDLDSNGQLRAFPLAVTQEQQQDADCPPGNNSHHHQQRIQFRPPQVEGKFLVQCEVAIGQVDKKPCAAAAANSSGQPLLANLLHVPLPPTTPGPSSSANCSASGYTSSSTRPLEQYLLAALLGVLLSLCLASLCLVGVHCLSRYQQGKQQSANGPSSRMAGRTNLLCAQPKRVQIVCPTSAHSSRLSLNSSALSFGSVPVQHSSLVQCRPPAPPPAVEFAPNKWTESAASSAGPISPASTNTTTLAFSLDKLPEPPNLSLAEIRQLNLAFNGLLQKEHLAAADCAEEETPYQQNRLANNGVYSFAGIRLLNSCHFGSAEDNHLRAEERG